MRWEKLAADEIADAIANADDSNFRMILSFITMLPVPGIVKDRTGRVLYMNRRAESAFNIQSRQACGLQVSDILQICDRHLINKLRHQDHDVIAANTAMAFFDVATDTDGRPRSKAARYAVLKFPFCDWEGDVLIGALMLRTSEAA